MKPFYSLPEGECLALKDSLAAIKANPYSDYPEFRDEVASLVASDGVPSFLPMICDKIKADREGGISDAHVLRNCPVDDEVPRFDHADPVNDKYRSKKTFIGEALLQVVSDLTGTPLLAYTTRNNGDFFHDVYAVDKYSATQTQKTDSDLFFHNDRTAHPVRADFLALLGMRCPEEDLIYTGYIDGRELIALLTEEQQSTLRKPYFVTPFDEYSRNSNKSQDMSDRHHILENHHSFRFYETRTTTASDAPVAAKDALLALGNAIAKAPRQRHRIQTRDLFIFANQDGLHNRELIEIHDKERARGRWLLKTYAFRDEASAASHADKWVAGVSGLVADS